jgi:hypothetical protein
MSRILKFIHDNLLYFSGEANLALPILLFVGYGSLIEFSMVANLSMYRNWEALLY